MTLAEFDQGDRLRIGNQAGSGRAAFTDIDGVVADPDAVLLTLKLPDGTRLRYGWPDPWVSMVEGDGTTVTEVDGVLAKEAAGRFYWDVTVRQPGRWRWRLASNGDPETAEKGEFWVLSDPVLT